MNTKEISVLILRLVGTIVIVLSAIFLGGCNKVEVGKIIEMAGYEWKVIEVDERNNAYYLMTTEKLTLKAEDISYLSAIPYADKVSWDDSILKQWLNDREEGFLKRFSEDELEKLINGNKYACYDQFDGASSCYVGILSENDKNYEWYQILKPAGGSDHLWHRGHTEDILIKPVFSNEQIYPVIYVRGK